MKSIVYFVASWYIVVRTLTKMVIMTIPIPTLNLGVYSLCNCNCK